MNDSDVFLLAMLMIFAIPYLVWRILRTDSYAPLVVVQIIAGILLGPGVLGAAFPGYYSVVFSPHVIAALNGIAWWAVMIFVWIAGIELDLKQVWKHRLDTSVTASLALGMPFLLGCIAAAAMLKLGVWSGVAGKSWQATFGIGMACAVTALPILVLFLDRLEILRSPFGQRVLRYASFDDVAIWGVLALILLDWNRAGRQLVFLVGYAVAGYAIRKLMARLPERDRWYVGLVWLAASGLAADWSGLHFMVGAFLAGAILDSDWFDRKQMDLFRDGVLLSIMPVFFLSTGLRTSWNMHGGAVLILAAVLLVASVVGKLLGVQLAGKILKWPRGDAYRIGWLLQTKALIMIIFVNILLDKGIIDHPTFTALLLMAVASTMLTMPMLAAKRAGVAVDAVEAG
ncbi:cation/H(+) antiporter [Paraburkholderia acidicola]|uniref:Cation/H(+) antiporter n=1 Tax=Paraburkholderia acidicola TaxID=1912599 RepID=A0A2A4F4W0_9BURK|nr:cation:proton antiporter [Paraburkholderia acidicola]PCE27426.1 cation/H(+) antiporter [Paraburkholderia acidicola]